MKIYHDTNRFLEECFHTLEKPMPSPVPTQHGDDSVLRYQKEHHRLEVAIVQKLARYISGLNASLLLLESGFTQEIGVIFRTLDEFREDILFLATPIIRRGEVTKRHNKYLEHFFQEEFDNPNNADQPTPTQPVPRTKIRAGMHEIWGDQHLHETMSCAFSWLYSVSSGYVHGNSFRICEMVDGDTLRYCLSGMAGTPRQDEFISLYSSHAHMGLQIFFLAANALGNVTVRKDVFEFTEHFKKKTGKTGSGDFEKFMKELKRKNT